MTRPIFPVNPKGLDDVAEKLLEVNPSIIEINLSCPNTENDFGKMFALEADSTKKVIQGPWQRLATFNSHISTLSSFTTIFPPSIVTILKYALP